MKLKKQNLMLIGMLYDERCPLYERFADITVSTTGVTPDQAVTQVLRQL